MNATTALPTLDLPTLVFIATAIAALLGIFMIFAWMQERSMRALAWWGAAYLIGGSAIALSSAPSSLFDWPNEIPGMLIFIACGVLWNGVRLFHARRMRPQSIFSGAAVWLIACQFPPFDVEGAARILLSAAIVSGYTLLIAGELWRERRRSLHSRAAAIIVPLVHATIFISPIALKTLGSSTDGRIIGSGWFELFVGEAMVYAVGTAIIMLMLVKDYHVHIHKSAASTDHLTGLLNRRAFLEGANRLRELLARDESPVTVLMFDLDRFKSINDTYGHAAGDAIIKLFASTARDKMRSDDIIGRLGGEEFAAIVPGDAEIARKIAERIRAGFEEAFVDFEGKRVATTVSIGAACARDARGDLDRLIQHADAALYRAKTSGRNRLCIDGQEAPTDPVSRAIVLTRTAAAAQHKTDEGIPEQRTAA